MEISQRNAVPPFVAQRELRERGWTDIHCAACGLVIGRVGLWPGLAGKLPAARAAHELERLYRGRQRIPLWCPGCRLPYHGHTPNSLINRVRRRRCEVLSVPY